MAVAFLVGAVLFAVWPRFFYPLPLQSADVRMVLLGCAGAALTGAALFLISGGRRGWWPVLLCPFLGAVLFQVFFFIIPFGDVGFNLFTTFAFLLMFGTMTLVPAGVGAGLGAALMAYLRRRRRVA